MEFLQNIWNSPSKYVIIFIAAIIVIYIPIMIVYMSKKKKRAAEFVQSNPDACKVYITGAAQGQLAVISVNGDVPQTFYEGTRHGFFLLPGESTVEAQYTWTRPGVLHKTVTTTIGPNKFSAYAEKGRTYNISFDKKAEEYTLEER